MLLRGMTIAAALAATITAGSAQAPVERGKYLVNTILTCQNCHTPKGERGAPIFERDLSGGLVMGRAAVQGDGVEHHAGQGDRHRQLE